jgi:hypothetical protein
MCVIIYITQCNQKLKLSCKWSNVTLRQQAGQAAVGSDIGLPYNASGGRRMTSGWEFACSLVCECQVCQDNTQQHPSYGLQLATIRPTVNYGLVSTSSQIPNRFQSQIAEHHTAWHEFCTLQFDLKIVQRRPHAYSVSYFRPVNLLKPSGNFTYHQV